MKVAVTRLAVDLVKQATGKFDFQNSLFFTKMEISEVLTFQPK